MSELFVALDNLAENETLALKMAEQLSRIKHKIGFKVNLDYFLKYGIEHAFSKLLQYDRPIFADLKMWNGERTMYSVLEQMLGKVALVSIYALAGSELQSVIMRMEERSTKILGVTVLSHYTDEYCDLYFHRRLQDTVRDLTWAAWDIGCDGIILPASVLNSFSFPVFSISGKPFIKVATGIRPLRYRDRRHTAEVEPRKAVRDGADILVCGGPITKNDDPVAAAKKILQEMEE